MVRVIDPTPEWAYRTADRLAPRPDTLDGKVIGLLQNHGWMGAPDQVERVYPWTAVEERLKERFHIAGTLWRVKPSIGRVAPKEVIDELVSNVDVVINGTCL